MIGRLFAVLLLIAPAAAFAFDLSAEFGLANRLGPRYAPQELWTSSTALNLGLALTDNLYVSGDFTTELATDYSPSTGDMLTLSWSGDALSAGLQVGGRFASGSKHVTYGGYLSGSLPLMGDLAELSMSLQARTDLAGWYGELKIAPTLYLPLDKPLMVNLNLIGGYATSGFAGLSFSGLTTLSVLPHVYLSLSKQLGYDLTAGYTFDVSGGQLPATAGPFVSGKVSWSYGD